MTEQSAREYLVSIAAGMFTFFGVMICAGFSICLAFGLFWAFKTNPWISRSCTVLDHEPALCPKKTEEGLGIVVKVDDKIRMVVKRFGKCKWHRSASGDYAGTYHVKGSTCTSSVAAHIKQYPLGSTHSCYTVAGDDLQEEICFDYTLYTAKKPLIIMGSLTGAICVICIAWTIAFACALPDPNKKSLPNTKTENTGVPTLTSIQPHGKPFSGAPIQTVVTAGQVVRPPIINNQQDVGGEFPQLEYSYY
eukprot:TRINITY_DN112886_c0_g1_i1.p1 TRINITY_DN112886_c0_g1~~TRINITY_DN112886_c0_g1_i1.p1  ORF type:complete len:249 (+),score=24.00 TRINITY_DN112886_c0_g1_i1:117-863(+)